MDSMKKYLLILLAVPVLMSNIMTACHNNKKGMSDGEDMPVAVAKPMVDSVVLRNVYPGNLTAIREVSIMARVNGVVTKVYASSGSKVKKGQLLYSIEDTKYQDAVREARASLATAKSAYEYYKNQYAAMQKALRADAISEMEVLEAKNNMEQSAASIETAEATLKSALTTLGYCTITAPFDGQLALASIDQDEYVNGEDSPFKLNTLYNDEVLHAYISIDESMYLRLLSNLEKGILTLDSVPVTFSQELPHKYYSKINYTSPDVDTSTGTVTMRFNFENKYGELKPGMFMNLELPYDVSPKAILVKDASIGTDQLGKYLYLVNDSNQVVYTPIEVGELYQDTLRIVTKGLTPESRYVTEALLKVRNGMKVKPIEK